MTTRPQFRVLRLVALIATGCAGSSTEAGAPTVPTPAAAVGDPSAELSPAGAAVTALPPPEPDDSPAANAQTPLPMFGAVVIHRVKDFDAWKSAFDTGLDARKQAGFAAQGIMRGVDNEKLVMVWVAVTEVDKAKAFFSDKALREQMKAAGVEGKPEIHVWSNVDAKMDPGKRGLSAALIISRIKDVAAFKTAFDSGAQARADAGIVGYGLSQDVDDKGTAYLYLQSEDPAKLKAYINSKETKQSWRDAGIKGAPLVTLVKEGEMMMYQ